MLTQDLYEYKMIHLQQADLQTVLRKYILLEKNILWLFETIEQLVGESTGEMQSKMCEIIASLEEALEANTYITNELQKRIIGIYELLKLSTNTSH